MISVITVHGLWMRGASMALLRRRLEPQGFRIHEFNYRSVITSLSANAVALAAYVDATPGDTVHLIGHSLGGVLIRAMLESRVPERVARVVCLGAPFRGSRTAARLARLPGGRHMIGRSLAELHARGGFDAWVSGIAAGSIAGRVPLGVGRLLGPFGEPNDGTVAVAETNIAGLRDHIVLPISHVALLWSAAVAAQAEQFLLHGRFQH